MACTAGEFAWTHATAGHFVIEVRGLARWSIPAHTLALSFIEDLAMGTI